SPLEVHHKVIAIETDHLANQIGAHVTAAVPRLSVGEEAHDHPYRQGSIARQRQVLTQELSILRDDRVCRDPVLVAQYTALGMSKTGLLAVEHHGAVGRDCRTSPAFAAGFGAKHS